MKHDVLPLTEDSNDLRFTESDAPLNLVSVSLALTSGRRAIGDYLYDTGISAHKQSFFHCRTSPIPRGWVNHASWA